jgi:hypothetical protein
VLFRKPKMWHEQPSTTPRAFPPAKKTGVATKLTNKEQGKDNEQILIGQRVLVSS